MACCVTLGYCLDLADVFFYGRLDVSWGNRRIFFLAQGRFPLRAWYISNLTRNDPGRYYPKVSYETSVPPPQTLIRKITSHPVWLALSADIFAGQVIASLIVLTFVAVFLLREWISQNARPGVFEDEELFPDMLLVANEANNPLPHPAPVPAAQNAFNQLVEQHALRVPERLQEELLVLDVAERRGDPNGRVVPGQGQAQRSGSESGAVAMNHVEAEERKGRMRRTDSSEEGGNREGGLVKGRRRSSSSSLTRMSFLRDGRTPYPHQIIPEDASDTEIANPFVPPSEPNIGPSANWVRSSTESLSSPSFGRRPPLPSSIPAFPGQDPLFTLTPSRTPLGSPSLATYRAPEELSIEAGSSGFPKSLTEGVHERGKIFDKKGKSPETLSMLSNNPTNGSSSQSKVAIPSQAFQTHGFVNRIGELEGVSPQSLSLELFQDAHEPEQYRSSARKSDRTPRELIDDFDLDTEMGYYFDTDEDDHPDSLLGKSEVLHQLAAPEFAAEARENEPEVEARREDEDEEDEEVDEEGDELLWNDAHWDGIEVEEIAEVPEQNAEGLIPPADANPGQVNRRREQGVEGGAIPQDLADDMEGGVEDDMEGALEGCHLSLISKSLLILF